MRAAYRRRACPRPKTHQAQCATDRAVMIQSDNVSQSRVYPNSCPDIHWTNGLRHCKTSNTTCHYAQKPAAPQAGQSHRQKQGFKRPVHQIRDVANPIAPCVCLGDIGARAVNTSTTLAFWIPHDPGSRIARSCQNRPCGQLRNIWRFHL